MTNYCKKYYQNDKILQYFLQLTEKIRGFYDDEVFEEFTIKSKGEFPMLKLNSATYYKQQRELVVKFIISAFEVRAFDEESKKKVQSIIEEMFSGITVSVQYIRTYADANVVKNKVLEFFNRTNQ